MKQNIYRIYTENTLVFQIKASSKEKAKELFQKDYENKIDEVIKINFF